MKKRQLNISKLNLNKEVISNLNEIKGGNTGLKKPLCYWWDENLTSAATGGWNMYTGDSCFPAPVQPICDR